MNPPTTSYIQCVMPAFNEAVQRLQKAKFTADILRSLKVTRKKWTGSSGGIQACHTHHYQDAAAYRP